MADSDLDPMVGAVHRRLREEEHPVAAPEKTLTPIEEAFARALEPAKDADVRELVHDRIRIRDRQRRAKPPK